MDIRLVLLLVTLLESAFHPARGADSIEAVRLLPLGTVVTASGIVTVAPGTFNRGFAIEDDSAGLYVYPSGPLPEDLKLGDLVQVTGPLAEYKGLLEITPVGTRVLRLKNGPPRQPTDYATGNIGEATEGRLVRLAGRVTDKSLQSFLLDDGSGPAMIYVDKNTGLDPHAVSVGQWVQVIGFSSQHHDGPPPHLTGYQVMPRGPADLLGEVHSIAEIQGSGEASPYEGQTVTVEGVVTGFFQDKGFFIQMPVGDGNQATSDGLYVYQGKPPEVQAGDLVRVTGRVNEFQLPEYGWMASSMTEIVHPAIVVLGKAELPAPQELNPPLGDTIAYWEALEGMLVQVPVSCTVVGPTVYDELSVVRADVPLMHPGRVFADEPAAGAVFGLSGGGGTGECTGAVVTGVYGPLDNAFDRYQVVQQKPLTVLSACPEVTAPGLGASQISLATFNLENFFDTTDQIGIDDSLLTDEAYKIKRVKLARTILEKMRSPTVIALQEAENASVLVDLAAEIALQGGPVYRPLLLEGADLRGLDVGLLVKADQVTIVSVEQRQGCTTLDDGFGLGQGCPAGENLLFSRPPLVARLNVAAPDGDTLDLYVIVCHFKSRVEGASATAPRRQAQAEFVANLVKELRELAPWAEIAVLGDLNESTGPVLQTLEEKASLQNLLQQVPRPDRYTYIYNGVSEDIDHLLVSPGLAACLVDVTIVHSNADFPASFQTQPEVPYRASDHDPVVARFDPPARFVWALSPGWHLLSLPLEPDSRAVGDVLSSLTGPYKVYVYDACRPEHPWRRYLSGNPAASDLAELRPGIGFWIQVENAGELVITGSRAISETPELCAGWNLIGYSSLNSQPIAKALASLEGHYSAVYSYQDRSDDPWRVYVPGRSGPAETLTEVSPGWGYWVYLREPAELIFSDIPHAQTDPPAGGR